MTALDGHGEQLLTADERRKQLVKTWREARAEGRCDSAYVRRQALANNLHPRHVWRLVAEGSPEPQRKQWQLTEEAIDLYYRYRGCLRRVSEALRDPRAPAYRQLARCFADQLGSDERAFVKEGYVARRAHSGCLRWEARHRNSIWQADHTQLKVPTLLQGRTQPTHQYLTYFLCCKSRMVMGWMLTEEATSDAVLEALRDAILVDLERDKPQGGLPDAVMFDNGMSFLADAVDMGTALLGIDRIPVESYSPNQNGKVERCHQTISRAALTDLPSWERGPRDRADKPYNTTPIAEAELIDRIAATIRWYNFDRPHSALAGRTPWAAFSEDSHALRFVAPERVRFALRERKVQKVQPSGVWKHGGYYRADELDVLVGKSVVVAWLRRDQRFVDVYDSDGAFICTATPNEHTLRDDEVIAIKARGRARHRKQTARLKRVHGHGHEERAPTNTVGGSPVVTRQRTNPDAEARQAIDPEVLRRLGHRNVTIGRWDLK